MTEADWLSADDPFPLISFAAPRMTERQRRLFAAACCRRIWHLLTDDRLRELVELSERCAEGRVSRAELQAAADALPRPGHQLPPPPPTLPTSPWEPGTPDPVQYRTFHFGPGPQALRIGSGIVNFRELPRWCQEAYRSALAAANADPYSAARDAAAEYAFEQASETHPLHARIEQLQDRISQAVKRIEDLRWRGADRAADEQAVALRQTETEVEAEIIRLRQEIMSDADSARTRVSVEERAAQAGLLRCAVGNPFREVVFRPEWASSTADGLARGMYESRDFAAMPILADALEDAGCDDTLVLRHCRDEGPHARGCWVVDRVLRKT